MATPKRFKSTEVQHFDLHLSNAGMGREIYHISRSFGHPDVLLFGTRPGVAETHAELFRISAPEMLIGL